MTDGKAVYVLQRLSPGDLGMHFELVRFAVRDEQTRRELQLAGWWIPHPAGGDKTVVLIHGYADAKVGAIAWAPVWRELGFHILAIDLRAHGESVGKYTTAGYFERHDLDQVLNQLRAMHPEQTRRLMLFGISLGSIVALATADLRDDLAGVVLECPLGHFHNGVQAHARLLGLPLQSLVPISMRIGAWLSGADFDAIDPLALIARLKCPVMAIQSGDDPFVPEEDSRAIESVIRSRGDASSWWNVEGAPHLLAIQDHPEEYRRRLANFVAQLGGES
jgi:hypothetical protein